MTREVKDLVYKAMEQYKATMNKYDFDSYTRYDKMNRLCGRILNDKLNSIYSDLYASVRCGFISKEEVEEYISLVKSCVTDIKREYVNALENLLGEEEFTIQWIMAERDYTRENAVDFYNKYYKE